MFAFITLVGSLAAGLNSLAKFVTRVYTYGFQFYNYMVVAAPPHLAAPPAATHSVLTIYRTDHSTTARGTVKVVTTSIEYHHDPAQSPLSGMASQNKFKRCKLRKTRYFVF